MSLHSVNELKLYESYMISYNFVFLSDMLITFIFNIMSSRSVVLWLQIAF